MKSSRGKIGEMEKLIKAIGRMTLRILFWKGKQITPAESNAK